MDRRVALIEEEEEEEEGEFTLTEEQFAAYNDAILEDERRSLGRFRST